jgi:hypothetical protein
MLDLLSFVGGEGKVVVWKVIEAVVAEWSFKAAWDAKARLLGSLCNPPPYHVQ